LAEAEAEPYSEAEAEPYSDAKSSETNEMSLVSEDLLGDTLGVPLISDKNGFKKYISNISPAKVPRPAYNDPLWLGNLMTYKDNWKCSLENMLNFENRAT
jgi:hypothetical protein